MEAMEFLTSSFLRNVPGLVHGFGRRMPGLQAEAHQAARSTFRKSGDVFFLKQVHSGRVVRPPWSEPPEGDASVSDRPGDLLGIETADCLPLFIVDPEKRRVAAAHAGWRGTVAQISRAAVRTLVDAGSDPAHLLAALGPSIGSCCYEVGPDVEEAFGASGSKFFVAGRASRKHLDLVAANRAQLEEAGLVPANIDGLGLCTRCREDLFFSYRRDGASAGRMISVVGFAK